MAMIAIPKMNDEMIIIFVSLTQSYTYIYLFHFMTNLHLSFFYYFDEVFSIRVLINEKILDLKRN